MEGEGLWAGGGRWGQGWGEAAEGWRVWADLVREGRVEDLAHWRVGPFPAQIGETHGGQAKGGAACGGSGGCEGGLGRTGGECDGIEGIRRHWKRRMSRPELRVRGHGVGAR